MWLWDKVINIGGRLIGLAEMIGLKYPVKYYIHQVSDNLYRGSRLNTTIIYQLSTHNLGTIINLCAEGPDDSETITKILGYTPAIFRYIRISVIDNTAPCYSQASYFLSLCSGYTPLPVYVHCEAGLGRTGLFCAIYRTCIQHWPVEEAIKEYKLYTSGVPCQIEFIKKFTESYRR